MEWHILVKGVGGFQRLDKRWFSWVSFKNKLWTKTGVNHFGNKVNMIEKAEQGDLSQKVMW